MKSTSDNYLENIVSLCPVESCHEDFLLQLFKECRPDLEFIGNLHGKQKDAIIFQQFTIEQDQLSKMYPDAEFNIVMLNREPIGRLYIYYGKTTDRILEIGLLEKYRSLGIGKKLVIKVIQNATKMNKNVSLQVAWFNQRAYGFYEKLNFKIVKNIGISYEMYYMP